MSKQAASTPTAPRRTPTAAVRGALVDAAVRVLERDGVTGLTVRAVAAEAAVAPMGVYNHLDGKGGLLLAVLQRGFDALRVAVAASAALPPAERLVESGRGYRRFALGSPVTYALMFGTPEASRHTIDPEALLPHAEPAFTALVDIVVAGQQGGTVRDGDPAAIALQIWSSVHGAVSLELTGNLHDPVTAEQDYEALLEMVRRGVSP